MKIYNVNQVKTHLSNILYQVESGDDVVVARYNQPVARIIPYQDKEIKRQFGSLKDVFTFDDSFFEQLPDSELSAWEIEEK